RLAGGTRYSVATGSLVDTVGTPIRPRLACRAWRDRDYGAIEGACGKGSACFLALVKRKKAGDIFDKLAANGVDPAGLVLAWDFTTASTHALTGWIRSVRDQAFVLGTPAFTVTSVDDGGGAGKKTKIWAERRGTFQAPAFM